MLIQEKQIVEKAFESCGFWPCNPDVFSSEDFAPANVAKRPAPSQIFTEQVSSDSKEDNIHQVEHSTSKNLSKTTPEAIISSHRLDQIIKPSPEASEREKEKVRNFNKQFN
ncbi:hypothetical protein QE152_g26621 [Popillia japonica]|uniref:Uncharacterized protein n=1 Tax=Popillia japonica TaxID=7064 RepID=A0AAW1JYM9_POPJA